MSGVIEGREVPGDSQPRHIWYPLRDRAQTPDESGNILGQSCTPEIGMTVFQRLFASTEATWSSFRRYVAKKKCCYFVLLSSHLQTQLLPLHN